MRHIIRLAPTRERREFLNRFYGYFQSKFKYTGKNNYSPLCVDYLHVYHRLNTKLRRVWDQMYTVSMRGHLGHNMALDQLIEKINKTCKQMIYGVVTPARIAKVVSSLNFIWPLERLHEEAMGLEEPQAQGDMGTSFSDDVRSLFVWFRQQFANNMQSMTQTSQINPIPASRFTNVHHPTAMVLRALKDDWKDWVDNRLSMRKFA